MKNKSWLLSAFTALAFMPMLAFAATGKPNILVI